MKDILLLIAGASIALFSTWVKSWIERKTHCSNEIFKQRLTCLNQIWSSFCGVKDIFGNRISLGHSKWAKQHGVDVLAKLNTFRRCVDEGQVILSKRIISEFRELNTYFFILLDDDYLKTSEYVDKLNKILGRLSVAINEDMNKRAYKIDLHLRT